MKTKQKSEPKREFDCQLTVSPKYDVIKLGIDWHAKYYFVARIIDGCGPEPAQRFGPEEFLKWASKQRTLAKEVYSCYEAGAGGFVLHRLLTSAGIRNVVIAPRKLDASHKRVQNDKLDSRELALDLDRFVRGNPKALRLVHVPTAEQEQRRQESRLREQLRRHRLSLSAQGRSLLLSQGWHQSNHWWKAVHWIPLQAELPRWMVDALETYRNLIVAVEQQIAPLQKKVESAAPAVRPKGMGALTHEALQREVCDWRRFRNRKSVGSYAGLAGGLSASGDYSCDLSITKAGHARLRTLLIELAWRWIYYQDQSKLVQRWAGVLLNEKAHARARKRAIVALARQLFVELWRWQTGQVTPEQLGWVMTSNN